MSHKSKPTSVPYNDLQLPRENIDFDVDAFDNLVRSHGVTAEIYSASLCPIDVDDPNDAHTHMHPNCQNGYLYRKEGETLMSFGGNVTSPEMTQYGNQDNSYVTATFPLYYDEPAGKPVILGQFYRIFIKDCPVAVVNSEKIEHHQTGLDRLSYPVLEVLRLTDNHGKEYTVGEDYEITAEGMLKWFENKSPGFNTKLGRGNVISILYLYRPFYYIARLPHEIRVSRDVNQMTGEISLVRMQSQAALQREWLFDNASQDPDDKQNGGRPNKRQGIVPRQGGFGPR